MPSYYRDPDAPDPNRPRRIGVIAIIEHDGALLMERRADWGTWGMPGGALDEGETVEEAIAREVLEETGLRVVGLELFGVFSDPSRIVAYPDGNVHRLLSLAFRAEVADGVPRVSEESLELRFVPHEAIRGLDLTPAQLPVLEAYLSARSAPVVE